MDNKVGTDCGSGGGTGWGEKTQGEEIGTTVIEQLSIY